MANNIVLAPFTFEEIRASVASFRKEHAALLRDFQKLWYHAGFTWPTSTYLGVNLMKMPGDIWAYQELVYRTQPDLLIETGTAFGGSALFFAHLMDHIGKGAVLSIDLEPPVNGAELPQHPRITYLQGSSTDPSLVAAVRAVAGCVQDVMVVLDSDHSTEHVASELDVYGPLVSVGQYLVVEDTNCHHEEVWGGDDGPGLALAAWLPQHPTYQPDLYFERWLVTTNPGGWVRRMA